MNDFNDADKQAIKAFFASMSKFTETNNYYDIISPFSGFDVVEDDPEVSGATFFIKGHKIYNAVFDVKANSDCQNDQNVIASLSLLCNSKVTTLSDCEKIFGKWYRDPPDGILSAFASAYFNSRNFISSADYFLLATTVESYKAELSMSSPVCGIHINFRDDRYSKITPSF